MLPERGCAVTPFLCYLCKKLELFSQQLSLKNNGPSPITLCIVLSWKPYLGPQCLFLNFTTNLDFTRTFWPRQCYVCFADFYFITRITEGPYLYIISSQYLSKQVNAAETIARQKDKKLKEAENKINTLVRQSA